MTEISTLITDYVLGILAGWLGVLLIREATRALSVRLWGWAFIAFSIAAFAGGTWHGFQLMLGERALFWIWKAVVYLVGAFSCAAVSGSIVAVTSGRLRHALLASIMCIAAIYGVFMTTRDDFIYIIYFNVAATLALLIIHMISHYRLRDAASLWIIAGVIISMIGAATQASDLSLHEHFNNNDLFHVIQMAGISLLFRGVRRLGRDPTHCEVNYH